MPDYIRGVINLEDTKEVDMEQCSELLVASFNSGCSGLRRTCTCGKTYYNFMDQQDFDEGEFEELEKLSKQEPEKYVAVDYSIGTMYINGIEIVIGCTCNNAERFEAFILRHASQLATYLRLYAASLRKRADSVDVSQTDSEIIP